MDDEFMDVELGGAADGRGYRRPRIDFDFNPVGDFPERAWRGAEQAADWVAPAMSLYNMAHSYGPRALDWLGGVSDSSTGGQGFPLTKARKILQPMSRRFTVTKGMPMARQRPQRRGYNRIKYNRTGGYVNKDYKFYDVHNTVNGLSDVANCSGMMVDPADHTLCSPPTGDSAFTREGQNLWIKSLQINGGIWINGQVLSADDTAEMLPTVKIWLVLDKQTNKAQMTSQDCFYNGMTGVGTNVHCVRNAEYTTRFKVLKEITIRPSMFGSACTHYYNGTHAVRTGAEVPFKVYMKFKKGLKMRMTGSTAGIGNCMDNSLHMIAATSVPDATTRVNLEYNCRTRFLG